MFHVKHPIKKVILMVAIVGFVNSFAYAKNECSLQGQFVREKTPVQICLDFSLWSLTASVVEPAVWGTIRFKNKTYIIPKTPTTDPFDVDCDGLFTVHFKASNITYGYDNWPRAKLKYGTQLNLIPTLFDKNVTLDEVTIGNVDQYLEVAIEESEKIKFKLTEIYVSPVHYMGDPIQKIGSNVVQEASTILPTK